MRKRRRDRLWIDFTAVDYRLNAGTACACALDDRRNEVTVVQSALALHHTASFAAFTARALIIFRAGQVFEGDERGREINATRIINLARQGIICPAALHHGVLADPLGF